MSEFCFFLCFKLYSLNFAIVHGKGLFCFFRIGHTHVALKPKKTDLSLETSSEINFLFVKSVKYLPLTITNREY